jgi:hypothetical protein
VRIGVTVVGSAWTPKAVGRCCELAMAFGVTATTIAAAASTNTARVRPKTREERPREARADPD